MDTACTLARPMSLVTLALSGLGNTKAVVVVPPRWVVPVAVGRTQVRRFVVPGAAAQNTVRVVLLPYLLIYVDLKISAF
jgi:hypothetical protein